MLKMDNKERDKGTIKGKQKRRIKLSFKDSRSTTTNSTNQNENLPTVGSLPPTIQRRLRGFFVQIENDFEKLHSENAILQEKLVEMTEKYEQLLQTCQQQQHQQTVNSNMEVVSDSADGLTNQSESKDGKGSKKPSTSQLMSQKIKTKYRASTSKFVSSLKMVNVQSGSLYCQMVQKFLGHKDGIWEVSYGKNSVVGTASADRTARIWNIELSQCTTSYQGHSGSVNSIRFHPSDSLVCTGSGDGTCHVWRQQQLSVINETKRHSPVPIDNISYGSADEENEEDTGENENQQFTKVKSPIIKLSGHEGPVSSADWWSGGAQIVSASWDRTVKLWDVEKPDTAIHTLEGHELEITHASVDTEKKLIVTSSQDTTFRLWDFRQPSMHSVNVFQGHTDTVTSAVFTNKADHVISGSDDRTVKVWDLKNMRSPLTTIRLDSAVNRLSLSPQNFIAIPHDNRRVLLYDLTGNRLSRLPRHHRQGHERIVCATCWIDDSNTKNIQLVSAGFDKQIIGWSIVNV